MRFLGLRAAVPILLVCPTYARQLPAGCGTHPLKLQEEMFLHRQAVRKRAATRAAAALPGVSATQDAGNIAVLDASGGVVIARNQFDLDQRTLSFLPATAKAGSYSYQLGDPSYDPDAAAAGRLLPLGDDDTAAVTLPFTFPFFGAAYQQVFVNSDGNLTFNAPDSATTERSLGRMAGGPPRIGALLADLDPSHAGTTGGVRVLSESARVAISWDHVPEYSDFGTGTRQTFQVRLYPDGRIEFAYSGISVASAVVGIAPGFLRGASTVLSFLTNPSAVYSSLVAERFSNAVDIDIEAAAQKFYQSHDDAYDYVAFYNNMGIPAGPSAVSWESTVRNHRTGYGDVPADAGTEFGSASRLQAVLNMGPLSQFPLDPKGRVPARAITGDTPVTILAHETGHLFLAYASVRDTADPNARPMLGFQSAHWVFNFNSDASLMEGNRIEDDGATRPEFITVGTVEGYSPLDQYLMGFLPPGQVEPAYPFGMFLVTGVPAFFNTRLPQLGVTFDGGRRDVHIDELIAAEGRRTPDSTVAQRRFRFAIVLIVPAGTPPPAADLAQLDAYRAAFEPFYQQASGNHAFADTALRHSLRLSVFPAAGVVAGRSVTATLSVDTPPSAPLTVALATQAGAAGAPASVTLPAGRTTVPFTLSGLRAGVEELSAVPADSGYDTAYARIQVASPSAVQVAAVSGDGQTITGTGPLPQPVVVRVTDINALPYPGVSVQAAASAGGSVSPAAAVTDADGKASYLWTPGTAASAQLRLAVEGAPDAAPAVVSASVPQVKAAAVLNAASLAAAAAPGMLATIYGVNLAGSSAKVTLDERALTVLGGDDGRVDFYIPADVPLGTANLVISNALGSSAPVPVTITAVAPGLYAPGFDQPVHSGDFISIYGTGLGVQPEQAQISIGGLPATVSYSGAAPGLLGVNQVNAQIPGGLAPGAQALFLTIQNVTSNEVQIGVE